MQAPPDTISVGDLLQRVAADASKKLLTMLEAMPAQTPELRFEKMKACIAKLKKQLCQLLALMMWLRDDNVQRYLQSMQALTADIHRRELQLDGVQDSFFFLHQSIYKRRRQALDVPFAADIMARGTYAHLPTSILAFKNSTEDTTSVASVLDPNEMNMFIGCKLCLGDRITDKIDAVDIRDGKLILKKSNYFEITLTLSHASELAYWIVSDVLFTAEHRITEGFIDSYGHLQLQDGVKDALNLLLRHNPLGTPAENAVADKCVLDTVYAICQHAALSVLLKLLYVQALYHSRKLSEGYTSVIYTDNADDSVLEFSFWGQTKMRSSGYPYMLRISLPRNVLVDTLSLALFRVLDPLSQGMPPVLINMSIPPGKAAVILEDLTCNGAAFSVVASAVLSLCAEQRLTLVYQLLSRSTAFASMTDFSVDMDSLGQCISITDKRHNFIRVCTCALTGKFIAGDTHQAWGNLKGAKECLSQFLGELNGVVMDINLKRVQCWEDAAGRLHGFSFQTLSNLLRFFVLFEHHGDFELLTGVGRGVSATWVDRLARAAGLENVVCSMYTLNHTNEVHRDETFNRITQFEVLTTFVIAVDVNFTVSYHVLSCCANKGKNNIPVFGEIFHFSDIRDITMDSVVDTGDRSSPNPILLLLRTQELLAPSSVCRFIAAMLHVRALLSVWASDEKIDITLQRRQLKMGNVIAFSDLKDQLQSTVDAFTNRMRLFACPLVNFSRCHYSDISAAAIAATSPAAVWAVSKCSAFVWCAVHKMDYSVIFFADMHSTRGEGAGTNIDELMSDLYTSTTERVVEEVGTVVGVRDVALSDDDIATMHFNLSRAHGMEMLVPTIQTTPSDAKLIQSRYLLLRKSSINSSSIAEEQISNIRLSTEQGLMELLVTLNQLCCEANRNIFERLVISPMCAAASTIEIGIPGVGNAQLKMSPLRFNIQLSTVITDAMPRSINFSADIIYRSLSKSTDYVESYLPIQPFDLVCGPCGVLTTEDSDYWRYNINGLNSTAFCRAILNYLLLEHSESLISVESVGNVADALGHSAKAIFPGCLLSWRIVQELIQSQRQQTSSSSSQANRCLVGYGDVLSATSFSIIVAQAVDGEVVCSFNIDIAESIVNSLVSYSYVITCRLNKGKEICDNYQSNDVSACAKHILSPFEFDSSS